MRSGKPATILMSSRAHSAVVRTLQAPPAAPVRFQPSDATPTELAFAWDLPAADAHGLLRGFVLEYASVDDPSDIHTIEFSPDGTLINLSKFVKFCSKIIIFSTSQNLCIFWLNEKSSQHK